MTKVLVISDVHANLIALEAVLTDAGKVNEVWCLGDVVGYGPQPNECIERIRHLPKLTCMMGNHDFAAINDESLDVFNTEARRALIWQRKILTEESREFLMSMSSEAAVRSNVTLAHGSPHDPIWEYVMYPMTVRFNMAYFSTPWCFVGHSHFQVIFHYDEETDEVSIEVPPLAEPHAFEGRAILNPGSVGQPRDRDPRSAYALYDPKAGTWEPRRVEYDIKSVQKMILDAGLPPRHAERLAGGW